MPPESPPEFIDISREELALLVPQLIAEVDTNLRSNQWILVPRGHSGVRLHSGAALWHACELLQDIVSMVMAGREMALRILNRALIEACLIGFYLHFGDFDALEAIQCDMKATLQAQQNDADQYDAELRREKKDIRKQNRRIRRENEAREQWNETRPPGTEPRPLQEEIPEPTRPAINLDLGSQLAIFADYAGTNLKMPTVVQRINALAKDKVPGEQNFGVIYTVGFRTLSSIGPHTNLQVLQSYFDPDWTTRTLVSLHPAVSTPTYADTAANTSLALVTLLAKWILGDVDDTPTPVVDQILVRFEGVQSG